MINEDLRFISIIFTFMYSVLCNLHIPGMPLVGVPHRLHFSKFYFLNLHICPILCNLHIPMTFVGVSNFPEIVLKKNNPVFCLQDQELGVGGFRLQLLARTGRPLQ
jgi:hypothetical protein